MSRGNNTGGPRKPLEIKALQGTADASRDPSAPVDPDLMSVESVVEPPAHLTDAQGEIFRELAGQLVPMGHIAESDRIALADLAELIQEMRQLSQQIQDEGYTYKRSTAMGDEIKVVHPALSAREKLAGRAFALMRQFGMTPSSRAGVQKFGGEQGDLLDGWDI